MNILLTGVTGFIGGALLTVARQRGIKIRPVLRSQDLAQRYCDPFNCAVVMPTLDADTDWSSSLLGIDVVVHCAARVHVRHDITSDPLTEFRKVNVAGTIKLAQQAAQSGVRRFVFISSIKVNGEETTLGHPFTADDTPAPKDAYGTSKAEAEAGLRQLASETGMEITIIRPTLVYGPGAKGNFFSLLRWVDRGLPLPLGGITGNRRSFVALDNLVDLIMICVEHPKAANQTFLVSDGEDLSTVEFLQRMGKALNRPARLLPIPARLLTFVAGLLGKKWVAQRLSGSLQVDISKTSALLFWKPPLSVDEGLSRVMEKRR